MNEKNKLILIISITILLTLSASFLISLKVESIIYYLAEICHGGIICESGKCDAQIDCQSACEK